METFIGNISNTLEQDFNLWLLFFLYTISIFVIYWFGFPDFMKTKSNFLEKEISHGISKNDIALVKEYNKYITEANLITVLGIVGLLFAMALSITNEHTITIPFFFLTAVVISDWLDGLACVRHDCHSKIGAILDPMRDRLAIILLVVVLFNNVNIAPVWILVLALATAEISTVITVLSDIRKQYVHSLGKIRQAIHLVATFLILCVAYLPNLDRYIIPVAAISILIMTLASVAHLMFIKEKEL